MPTGNLSQIGQPISGKGKLSDIELPSPTPVKAQTGKANLSDIAKPPVALPNLKNSINSALDTGLDYAKRFNNWGWSSVMPDAEDAIGDLADRLPIVGKNSSVPIIGDTAGPVVRAITGGATSPFGLVGMGLAAKGISKLRAPKVEIPLGPITKEAALVEELKGATRLTRRAQDAITSEERSKRIIDYSTEMKALGGGEGAHDIAKGKLAGEIPKVEYKPIREKFATADNAHIDDFHKQVEASDALTPYDKVAAHNALNKVLGAKGVTVPKPSEIELLGRVFGPDIEKTLYGKSGSKLLNFASVPRTVMASGDVSFPFRQNISNVSRPEFWNNIPRMIKSIPDKGYQETINLVKADPHYKLALRSGVNFSIGGKTEENFASAIAHYYPGVNPSERAFSGYANKMRMDLFSQLVDKAKTVNKIDAYSNPKYADELAKFVNTSTGRGTLKVGSLDFERSAKTVNALAFSPRLATSRVQMFSKIFDPSVPNPIRKEYIRNALGFMGYQGALLTAAALGGYEVGTKITSPDFAKIKIGDTRLDFSGGVNAYVRLIAQLTYNEKTSSVSGKTVEMGKGYGVPTGMDAIGAFVSQKAAPIPATAMDVIRRKDAVGQPISISSEAYKLLTPIIIQDINDIVTHDPSNLPYIIPALFGVGVQTYGKQDIPKTKSNTTKLTVKLK